MSFIPTQSANFLNLTVTGTSQVPTQPTTDSSTKIASTAFVKNAASTGTFTGITTGTLTTTGATQLATGATLVASPANGNSSTQIATTAFVASAISSGGTFVPSNVAITGGTIGGTTAINVNANVTHSLGRTIPNGGPNSNTLNLSCTQSNTTTPGNIVSALAIQGTKQANTGSGFIWVQNLEMDCYDLAGENVGIGVFSRNHNTATVASGGIWCLNLQCEDFTGRRVDGRNSMQGIELDLACNGTDGQIGWTPIGGRLGITINPHDHVFDGRGFGEAAQKTGVVWAPNVTYITGAVVTNAQNAGHVYVNNGSSFTSGGTAPNWSAGNVTDNGHTWTYLNEVQSQISRLIAFSNSSMNKAQPDPHNGSQIGIGIHTDLAFYGSFIDCSQMTTVASGGNTPASAVAAFRLPANVPIDFSGNGTQAGMNVNTLRWDANTNRFSFQQNNVNTLGISGAGFLTLGTGPSISYGTGVPGAGTPGSGTPGSIFLRTDGATGSTMYCYSSSAWHAVAGA